MVINVTIAELNPIAKARTKHAIVAAYRRYPIRFARRLYLATCARRARTGSTGEEGEGRPEVIQSDRW